MKFLLVALNAKYIHSNPALYSLRAYAGEEYSENIELAEHTINHSNLDIIADIYKRKPDAIGFSCYIWNIDMVLRLSAELRKLLPETHIWLGGPEASNDASNILERNPFITGVILGEGEETFKELLWHYVNHGVFDFEDVLGLGLPKSYTGSRELLDMNKLPFLYNDLDAFENRIIYYESSRGCPYNCSYCLSSIDKNVRFRDIDIVKKELKFFLDNKVRQVKFVDRTFNCNHEHAIAIWKYILENDNGITNFHFEISADILNDVEIELLRKMRPGLVQLEIGVQSVNPDTLKAINRRMDVDKLCDIVTTIGKGNNVHMHLDLIAGLPYEDYESFGKSFDAVYAMKPEQLQLGFLKVLKGSAMFDKAEEYGICYGDTPPYEVMFTRWLSFDEVLRLKQIEEMVEIYYNSNQFTNTMNYLVNKFSSAFAMYEALAQFYEAGEYFINSPSRGYRYDILLEYAKQYDAENEGIYRELLTYDMYLRDNLKSRPSFAKDLKAYRKEIVNFYKEEEEKRVYLPEYDQYDSRQLERMTHIEVFDYSVWDMQGDAVKLQNPVCVLFDYKNRSMLTSEAKIRVINS